MLVILGDHQSLLGYALVCVVGSSHLGMFGDSSKLLPCFGDSSDLSHVLICTCQVTRVFPRFFRNQFISQGVPNCFFIWNPVLRIRVANSSVLHCLTFPHARQCTVFKLTTCEQRRKPCLASTRCSLFCHHHEINDSVLTRILSAPLSIHGSIC